MHVSLFLRCFEQIQGQIILSRGKSQRTTKWLISSGDMCLNGKPEALVSSPGQATIFSSREIYKISVYS